MVTFSLLTLYLGCTHDPYREKKLVVLGEIFRVGVVEGRGTHMVQPSLSANPSLVNAAVPVSLTETGAPAVGNDHAGAKHGHAGISPQLHVRQRLRPPAPEPRAHRHPGEGGKADQNDVTSRSSCERSRELSRYCTTVTTGRIFRAVEQRESAIGDQRRDFFPRPAGKAELRYSTRGTIDAIFVHARRNIHSRIESKQILDRAERQLRSIPPNNWNGLDSVTWELVHNW